MSAVANISGHRYAGAQHSPAHAYLLPAVKQELAPIKTAHAGPESPRLFDLGCGNGSFGSLLAKESWEVHGVDPSVEGIEQARQNFPNLHLESGSAYEDLAARFGTFPVVISLEVVEHVYAPRDYARTLFDLLEPGGTAIVSTPYHGYVKNLALAMTGKMNAHLMPLKDHGHIKFWSIPTLTELLRGAGFETPRFQRVGRIPPLAKSMIAIAHKPVA